MRLTFASDTEAHAIDVAEDMELGDIMALLEAETGIPTDDQAILYGTAPLTDRKKTLRDYQVKEDDVLILRNSRQASISATGNAMSSSSSASQNPASSAAAPAADGSIDSAAEYARAQILQDPNLMRQLEQSEPEIADAARNDPAKFKQLYNARGERYAAMQREKHQMEELLMADPFDIEAQKKIEEAIRQQQVLENMEHAMEFSPESFGRVTMLYVNVEVNGQPVKAFVDSGAQATIISPDCAERCGIMRLLDTRFSGIARGVGTARILGRIHSAQIKVGDDLFLPCAFTVMEGKGVELLFGLDMLKRYQACIDLAKNSLIIQGREVRFLSEHELPRNALEEELEVDENGNIKIPSRAPNPSAALGAAAAASAARSASSESGKAISFTGQGRQLRGKPSGSSPSASAAPGSSSQWPASSIEALTNMGVARDEAIRLLDASNGNVDMAANLMF